MQGLTAPRTFSPGEVIFQETPFLELLCRSFKDVACESCFEKAANLKSCKECLSVKYCGKSCQKKHWKTHRLECKNLKNLPAENPDLADRTRLIGNITLMIKDKDLKTIKSNILGTEISFDDIGPCLEAKMGNHLGKIRYVRLREHVRRYIGDENMPDEEYFKKVYGKLFGNFSLLANRSSGCDTVSFPIGLSTVQQECIPNCCITQKGNSLVLWAFKKIKKYEKLSVSNKDYFNSYTPVGVNTEQCKCSDCSLPYGESVLSRIEDENRAFEVILMTQHFLAMWRYFPFVRGMPFIKFIVDDLLQSHKGALGTTNILHLKLLCIRCFEIGGHPLETKRNLLELEKNAVSVFGEYFPSMIRIYRELSEMSFALGNFMEGMSYSQKVNAILKFGQQ